MHSFSFPNANPGENKNSVMKYSIHSFDFSNSHGLISHTTCMTNPPHLASVQISQHVISILQQYDCRLYYTPQTSDALCVCVCWVALTSE